MNVDELFEDGTAWRYRCLTCGYLSIPVTRRRGELTLRIHRHRHRAGTIQGAWRPYQEGNDT